MMIFGKYAAIGGAVAIGLLWPFATGQIGQSVYEREVAALNTPYFKVMNKSYDRGYLSSYVVTEISITGGMEVSYEELGLPTTFTLQTEVDHGLMGISSLSVLEMTPELKALAKNIWPQSESPLTIFADTSILGDTQYVVTMLAMKGQGDELHVESSEATVSGLIDKDGNVIFDLEMPSLNLSSPDGESISLNQITGSGQGQMIDEMWVGVQRYNIAKSTFTDTFGETITLEQMGVDVKNDLQDINGGIALDASKENLRIDSINTLSFKSLSMPEVGDVSNFRVGFNFYKLDYQGLLALVSVSNTMNDEMTEEDVNKLVAALDQLVEKGMTVELLPLEVDTPEGNIDGKFDLTIAPGLGSVTQNVSALTSKLSGKLSLTLPNSLVQLEPSIADALDNFETYGFVSRTDNAVTLSAKIEGEQAVSATGQQIPLGLLLMMFM